MSKTIGQRVLERAAEKLGEPRLAALLQISIANLRAFVAGSKGVPDSVLLRAIDIVLDQAPATKPPMTENGKDPKRKPSS